MIYLKKLALLYPAYLGFAYAWKWGKNDPLRLAEMLLAMTVIKDFLKLDFLLKKVFFGEQVIEHFMDVYGAMTLSIRTLSITTLSIMGWTVTHSNMSHSFIVLLHDIMLSVLTLNVIMLNVRLNVIMQNVGLLSVVAPCILLTSGVTKW